MVFTEKQSAKKLLLVVLPLLLVGTITLAIDWYDATNPLRKDNLQSQLIITGGVTALVLILFLIMSLRTKITKDGIIYSYTPFVKEKQLKWDELEKVWVRKYKPIREYGGWGLRIGFGKGKAYNIWGTKGLQLVFKNGKQLLIGTQKPKELATFLKRLKEKHSIDVISEAKLNG